MTILNFMTCERPDVLCKKSLASLYAGSTIPPLTNVGGGGTIETEN